MWNFIEEDPAAEVELDPDDGTLSLDCFLRIEGEIVFNPYKSMYYIFNKDGDLLEEVNPEDVPIGWKRKFEKEIE